MLVRHRESPAVPLLALLMTLFGLPVPARAASAERTLKVALEVDRDGARLIAFALEDRPFAAPQAAPEARASAGVGQAQFELLLRGKSGAAFVRRFEVGPLCLEHAAGAEPHVAGDTIAVHRESFVIDLPERAGYDQLEVARYEARANGQLARRPLARERLDAGRFAPAGRPFRYSDLAFAEPAAEAAWAPATTGDVLWPEQFGDPENYLVYGNAAQLSRRTTILLVPDGYTYAEKATLRAHADDMVASLRARTPYREHDEFLNYVLVYAYSRESGTDQCDCGIVKDTAMATHFQNANPTCGHSDNRCLYYGNSGSCDSDTSAHLAAAELRAPGFDYSLGDRTIVLVNTPRYGGCGGSRAVFSAANPSASDIAVHELGHSMAGLADEYGGSNACGAFAGEINTSRNASSGAWPEWIAEIGSPVVGGQYYEQCIYRPQGGCEMRTLFSSFCAVCNQHFSLVFLSQPRVYPTAPIDTQSPGPLTSAVQFEAATFSVATRLGGGASQITWQIRGPEDPAPVTVQTGGTVLVHAFATPGSHAVTCRVIADTNFIKPAKYGANVDVANWTVQVAALCPDGIPDQDADGDHRGDHCDNCPAVANSNQSDVDQDGQGDACDGDDDNDTLADAADNCPLVPNLDQADGDADGRGNPCDNCPLVFNPEQANADGDLLGDACDACPSDAANDPDGDGICSFADNCPALANPGQADSDGDALGDVCDPDDDNDLTPDVSDNCPLVYNYQEDFERDGVGDACDNCPYDVNRAQSDLDADLVGDVCDIDDGLILQFRTEPGYIEWQAETGFATFNVYEGDLALLAGSGVYTQAPGSNPLAERSCGAQVPFIEDFDSPPAGRVQFSLVTGNAAGIESELGRDSRGTPRPNANPCP